MLPQYDYNLTFLQCLLVAQNTSYCFIEGMEMKGVPELKVLLYLKTES